MIRVEDYEVVGPQGEYYGRYKEYPPPERIPLYARVQEVGPGMMMEEAGRAVLLGTLGGRDDLRADITRLVVISGVSVGYEALILPRALAAADPWPTIGLLGDAALSGGIAFIFYRILVNPSTSDAGRIASGIIGTAAVAGSIAALLEAVTRKSIKSVPLLRTLVLGKRPSRRK